MKTITLTRPDDWHLHLRDGVVLQADSNQQRGEFVLLVEPTAPQKTQELSQEAQRVLKCLLAELPLKQAVALATEITQLKRNDLYEFALQLKKYNE